MAGEFDGVVDSIGGSSRETAASRARGGMATNARGESPAVDARPDYHTDQPIDRRQPFAKSASDDGGLSMLASPNERGPSTREALMAADQSDVVGAVAMKPRSVEVQRGDAKAKRGSGAIMSSEDVGLALQPITIQRQADVDDMGVAVDPEGIKPKVFLSDGTSAGGQRIDRAGGITADEAATSKTAATMQPVETPAAPTPSVEEVTQAATKTMQPRSAPVQEPVMPAPARSKQRVIFTPPGGGKIRTNVEHAVIGDGIIILMYDVNAETSYEPPKADSKDPIQVQIGDKQFKCIYGEWSAEDNGTLYLVLMIVGDAASS